MLLAILYSIALSVLLLMIISLYRLLFHPLSSVPGPKAAALSNAWLAWHARNGRVRELGKTLHKRYGPVVRVGPSEVWFDSKDAFKVIYSEYSRAVRAVMTGC
jgi:hypothetical protein